jgi:hypothetical protein
MSTSAWRSFMLTSPGPPSPMVHDPLADLNSADRCDHGGGAACEDLGKGFRPRKPALHSSTLIFPSSAS